MKKYIIIKGRVNQFGERCTIEFKKDVSKKIFKDHTTKEDKREEENITISIIKDLKDKKDTINDKIRAQEKLFSKVLRENNLMKINIKEQKSNLYRLYSDKEIDTMNRKKLLIESSKNESEEKIEEYLEKDGEIIKKIDQ